eukprot:TRINITY_DN18991_c0_g1_i3.p1 TRINITY_DN18991_c0_g1~~TRINITY_DN18991_c0_g1_i3.p1  ORF type:complete len:255 (+),score=-17.47 TRINITY_DN18991_c0_g1_i3:456-1220(+)
MKKPRIQILSIIVHVNVFKMANKQKKCSNFYLKICYLKYYLCEIEYQTGVLKDTFNCQLSMSDFSGLKLCIGYVLVDNPLCLLYDWKFSNQKYYIFLFDFVRFLITVLKQNNFELLQNYVCITKVKPIFVDILVHFCDSLNFFKLILFRCLICCLLFVNKSKFLPWWFLCCSNAECFSQILMLVIRGQFIYVDLYNVYKYTHYIIHEYNLNKFQFETKQSHKLSRQYISIFVIYILSWDEFLIFICVLVALISK